MSVKCILAQVRVLLAAAALFERDSIVTVPKRVELVDLEVEVLQQYLSRLILRPEERLHTGLVDLRQREVGLRSALKEEAPIHGTPLHRANALVVRILSELERRAASSHARTLRWPEVFTLTLDVLGRRTAGYSWELLILCL